MSQSAFGSVFVLFVSTTAVLQIEIRRLVERIECFCFFVLVLFCSSLHGLFLIHMSNMDLCNQSC